MHVHMRANVSYCLCVYFLFVLMSVCVSSSPFITQHNFLYTKCLLPFSPDTFLLVCSLWLCLSAKVRACMCNVKNKTSNDRKKKTVFKKGKHNTVLYKYAYTCKYAEHLNEACVCVCTMSTKEKK